MAVSFSWCLLTRQDYFAWVPNSSECSSWWWTKSYVLKILQKHGLSLSEGKEGLVIICKLKILKEELNWKPAVLSTWIEFFGLFKAVPASFAGVGFYLEKTVLEGFFWFIYFFSALWALNHDSLLHFKTVYFARKLLRRFVGSLPIQQLYWTARFELDELSCDPKTRRNLDRTGQRQNRANLIVKIGNLCSWPSDKDLLLTRLLVHFVSFALDCWELIFLSTSRAWKVFSKVDTPRSERAKPPLSFWQLSTNSLVLFGYLIFSLNRSRVIIP